MLNQFSRTQLLFGKEAMENWLHPALQCSASAGSAVTP